MYVKEIFDPVIDFYLMRLKRKREIMFFLALPLLVGFCFILFTFYFNAKRQVIIDEFILDLLNQLITVLTLFISFSMAYLSVIISSSSKNIDEMKNTYSKYYDINGASCTLFQVLMSDLTYTLIIEIIFLLGIFFEKFLMYMCTDLGLKIIITIDVAIMVHVLILMAIAVKNIYYSFWKR